MVRLLLLVLGGMDIGGELMCELNGADVIDGLWL